MVKRRSRIAFGQRFQPPGDPEHRRGNAGAGHWSPAAVPL